MRTFFKKAVNAISNGCNAIEKQLDKLSVQKAIVFLVVCVMLFSVSLIAIAERADSYAEQFNDGYCTNCGHRMDRIHETLEQGQYLYTYKCSNSDCKRTFVISEYWYNQINIGRSYNAAI